MKSPLLAAVVAFALSGICSGARCTTTLDPSMLVEYQSYISAVEERMMGRFDSGELSWAPPSTLKDAAAKLAAGKAVRYNLTDASVNQRIAPRNATILHWIGAIRIPGASLADLDAVLQDHDQYHRIYHPIMSECRTTRVQDTPQVFDGVLGLQNTFRFTALFPQRFAFRAQVRIDHSESNSGGARTLGMHLSSADIRESDSGVPGRDDFLERHRDHGIMWALDAYWRARQHGSDLYLEFETISLARSVQAFVCKLGFVPVPKSVIAGAMDALPAESVTVILEGTKAECARRSARQ